MGRREEGRLGGRSPISAADLLCDLGESLSLSGPPESCQYSEVSSNHPHGALKFWLGFLEDLVPQGSGKSSRTPDSCPLRPCLAVGVFVYSTCQIGIRWARVMHQATGGGQGYHCVRSYHGASCTRDVLQDHGSVETVRQGRDRGFRGREWARGSWVRSHQAETCGGLPAEAGHCRPSSEQLAGTLTGHQLTWPDSPHRAGLLKGGGGPRLSGEGAQRRSVGGDKGEPEPGLTTLCGHHLVGVGFWGPCSRGRAPVAASAGLADRP